LGVEQNKGVMKTWTKTTDGLPTEGLKVLCYNKLDGKFIAMRHGDKWRRWGRDGFESPGWEYHNVTYWTELPDDPE